MSAGEHIERLLTGNRKFVSKNDGIIQKHLDGQKPFAAILTCSDSRVPPELIFDVGIGEIFVVRDAGNIAMDASAIGSLEYAVEHLHVPLVVVMGHTRCGALHAAEQGPGDDSNVGEIVDEIRCCFLREKDHVKANIRMQMGHLLEKSQAISKAVESGETTLKGAVYHLEDGSVEFLD
ncbi:MAG: carbonic anhydrase [Thermoplasmata archaeon]